MGTSPTAPYDVAVVGGGVVGLAVVRELSSRGLRCICLEQAPHLLGGFDAPEGSVERECIRDAHANNLEFCRSRGIPAEPVGSLIVAFTKEELRSLPSIVEENHAIGDTDVRQLSRRELFELEPNLNPDALGGVFVPGETLVEPWMMAVAYAAEALQRGAEVVTSAPVQACFWDGKVWALRTGEEARAVYAHVVVNACGLFADQMEQTLDVGAPQSGGDGAMEFEVRPRKGQYVLYSKPAQPLVTRPIAPVPTQYTKGVLLFPNVHGNIVVGPTAEDVTERDTPASTDEATILQLRKYAEWLIPGLSKQAAVVGTYAGLRPATEHRDYQMRSRPESNWVTVAGIRSTGLTASQGIARRVSRMVSTLRPTPSKAHVGSLQGEPPACALNMRALQQEFQLKGSVTVCGRTFHVTHPQTRLGWQKRREHTVAPSSRSKL